MARKNIFVVGLDPFNLAQLEALDGATRYRFHPLTEYREAKRTGGFPVREIVARGRQVLDAFPGPIDAIIGYWDFPVSTALPLLRRPYGLPGPSLEAVLRCEHKYWSRLEQQRVVQDHVPAFAAVDPFTLDSDGEPPLPFPFWLKPVKAASSLLGYRIDDRGTLRHALGEIRDGIGRLAEPFNYVLAQASVPPEVAAVDGYHCIAEGIISRGRQCTLEGYVYHGEPLVYGVVDSIREGRHRSCFARYQYPSQLPAGVRGRMEAVVARFLRHIGYDDAPFNAEFYWDRTEDRIWLLEVNTRISKSHCPLFHMVDGAYHHQVNVDLGLGRRPRFPCRRGRYRVAAKFMLRRYADARVVRVPSPADLAAVTGRFPEALVQVHVTPGMRLSGLRDQDSYSYRVAEVFLGAADRRSLMERYRECVAMLGLEFETGGERRP